MFLPEMFLSDSFELIDMVITFYIIVLTILVSINGDRSILKVRKRRYLLFTKDTQWGVYVTVSVPIESFSYVSVAWFYEASYYAVDNATYFDPLLGDVYTMSRNKKDRSIETPKEVLSRSSLYTFIEDNLERHGYEGRACLLRAICENANDNFLHNGLLGDLIYLTLTPSTSLSEEDIEDSYYEAEYYGLEKNCDHYIEDCPSSPLRQFSLHINDLL